LIGFVKAVHPNLYEDYCGSSEKLSSHRKILIAFYQTHANQFQTTRLNSITDVDKIRKDLVFKVKRYLPEGSYDPSNEKTIHNLVGGAVKQLTGAKNGALKGGEYDIAQIHSVLKRKEIEHKIIDWVLGIFAAKCPNIKRVLNITDNNTWD
jgi:hypothetical protein